MNLCACVHARAFRHWAARCARSLVRPHSRARPESKRRRACVRARERAALATAIAIAVIHGSVRSRNIITSIARRRRAERKLSRDRHQYSMEMRKGEIVIATKISRALRYDESSTFGSGKLQALPKERNDAVHNRLVVPMLCTHWLC